MSQQVYRLVILGVVLGVLLGLVLLCTGAVVR